MNHSVVNILGPIDIIWIDNNLKPKTTKCPRDTRPANASCICLYVVLNIIINTAKVGKVVSQKLSAQSLFFNRDRGYFC